MRGKGRDKVRVESRKLGERPSALRFPNFGGSKRIAVICSLAACNSAFMSWARVQVRIRVRLRVRLRVRVRVRVRVRIRIRVRK